MGVISHGSTACFAKTPCTDVIGTEIEKKKNIKINYYHQKIIWNMNYIS